VTPPEVQPMERVADQSRDLAPGLRLLGYDLPVAAASPGETLRLALYWQAIEDIDRDYQISVQLIDSEGNPWLEQKGRPVDGTYPTTKWGANEVLRDWHDLVLPPDAPQGRHEVLLQVLENGEALGELQLGSLEVKGRARQFTVPSIEHPAEAIVGSGVLFLGYDLNADQVQAGEALKLTLYWQALQEVQVSYTVFTHLLDVEETVWGQADSIPQGGAAPTTSWVQEEIITDEYEIVVDQKAPPGTYVVEVGMYDASTGLRLPIVADGERLAGDRLLLQEIQVLP
jgi:hypothetical protein